MIGRMIKNIFNFIKLFFSTIFNSIYNIVVLAGSKLNKTTQIIILMAIFFLFYFISFNGFKGWIDSNKKEDVVTIDTRGEKNQIDEDLDRKEKEEKKKSGMQRLHESRKLFISNDEVENIKIDGEILDSFKRISISFVKLRGIEGEFKPKNKGNSNNNISFETDMNYFVIKYDNKTEYYKIPVAVKNDFEDMYTRMIYTSVDYITNKKDLGKIVLYKGDEQKSVLPWRKDDLVDKILYKREVGKIQPEKDFNKSKVNFTIKINKSNREIVIQTMGMDFIKVTSGDNVAYYEVYQDLYKYLDEDVFKEKTKPN